MLESWLFQFFLKGNWQINTTLFSQYRKPVNQRTIFLNFRAPIFRSGKWCKGKAKKLNHQIFGELFSNFFFQEPSRQPVPNAVSLIAGAKIPLISYSPNFLHTFLQKKSKLANPVPLSPLYINIGIGSSVGRGREFKEIREVKEFREGAINLLIEGCRYNTQQIVSCQKLWDVAHHKRDLQRIVQIVQPWEVYF